MHFPQNTCDICAQHQQQQQQNNTLKLRKNHKSAYQLQELALNCCGNNLAATLSSPPVYDDDVTDKQQQHSNITINRISPQHFRSFSIPHPNQQQEPPVTWTATTAQHFRHHNSSPIIGLHKSASVFSIGRRRNSSYHSCDELDGVGGDSGHNFTERRVVASIKYLCACTGATLRNLTKKTKDLHANYSYQKPTWRYWGEEPENNAIFTVYLKKVRYHRPTPTVQNDSDDEISHLEWETVRVRFVKAATLERLVEALATDDGELESTFINVFLSTYRTFSTPKEVLNLLMRRYDTLHDKHQLEKRDHHLIGDTSYNPGASIHEQHKKTLVSALHVWLDGFPEDWNEENLRQLRSFAAERLPRSELFLKVQHRLELLLRQHMYGGNRILRQPPPHSYVDVDTGLWMGGGMDLPPHYNAELAEKFNGLYLAAIQHGHPQILQAFRFPHVPVRHFAEQLTRMDSEVFKRLIPHQCLGATWARRDKGGSETVVATIDQFNKVLYRVWSSILLDPSLKPQFSVQERALNVGKWIDIAQELRLLKNFSSLKAIISGLESNPIFRLTKTWAMLTKEKVEIFNELAKIFSSDNNAWAQREVLMREGTAKFADTVGADDRHLKSILQKQSTQTSHGTIPFLGTFLTDLQMIHSAFPNNIAGLVNFDKKRKEFEMLAQIKLLQGAANTYNLREDSNFDRWFDSMFVLDEQQAHMLACQLESSPTATRKSNASANTSLTGTTTTTNTNGTSNKSMATIAFGSCVGVGGNGHRKTDSIASNSSSGNGSQFNWECHKSSSYSSRHNSLDRDAQLQPNMSLISTSSSTSNLSIDSSNSGGQKSSAIHSKLTHSQSVNGSVNATTAGSNGTPLINAQLVQPVEGGDPKAPNFYIIRVTYETANVELDGIVLYKSIMLGNNERTPQVIRNAMLKLGLEDADPERYTLAQVLPDREFVLRKDANVFYAVNTNYNLNFILRPKKDGADDS